MECLTTLTIPELEKMVEELDSLHRQLYNQLRVELNLMPAQTMNPLAGIDQELAEAKHQVILLNQHLHEMT